eukprot:GHVP01050469.1.p2 GENE.GHVP01050469.1~~GHVP01050469.1.p2  ORF type:complete len:156 (-),score=26.45 GHVP01050469.1:92-559(-)
METQHTLYSKHWNLRFLALKYSTQIPISSTHKLKIFTKEISSRLRHFLLWYLSWYYEVISEKIDFTKRHLEIQEVDETDLKNEGEKKDRISLEEKREAEKEMSREIMMSLKKSIESITGPSFNPIIITRHMNAVQGGEIEKLCYVRFWKVDQIRG